MADDSRIIELITRQLHGNISAEEKAELDAWINQTPENRRFVETYLQPELLIENLRTRWASDAKPTLERHRKKTIRKICQYGAAASLLIAGIYIWHLKKNSDPNPLDNSKNRSISIKDKIAKVTVTELTLTLSDGTRINIDQTDKKSLARQAGYKIVKEDERHLAYLRYDSSDIDPGQENIYNTLYTPENLDSVQIMLPDGTIVYISAGSVVYFPLASRETTLARVLALYGEAFFDVFPNKLSPFIVETKNSEVSALGTFFRVRDYGTPESNTVTSITGKIEVYNGWETKTLVNGQGLAIGAALKTMLPSHEYVIPPETSWKTSRFHCTNRSLGSVIQEISKWYALEAPQYDPAVDTTTPGTLGIGDYPKHLPLQTLLKRMCSDHLHFEFDPENSRIIVHP